MNRTSIAIICFILGVVCAYLILSRTGLQSGGRPPSGQGSVKPPGVNLPLRTSDDGHRPLLKQKIFASTGLAESATLENLPKLLEKAKTLSGEEKRVFVHTLIAKITPLDALSQFDIVEAAYPPGEERLNFVTWEIPQGVTSQNLPAILQRIEALNADEIGRCMGNVAKTITQITPAQITQLLQNSKNPHIREPLAQALGVGVVRDGGLKALLETSPQIPEDVRQIFGQLALREAVAKDFDVLCHQLETAPDLSVLPSSAFSNVAVERVNRFGAAGFEWLRQLKFTKEAKRQSFHFACSSYFRKDPLNASKTFLAFTDPLERDAAASVVLQNLDPRTEQAEIKAWYPLLTEERSKKLHRSKLQP